MNSRRRASRVAEQALLVCVLGGLALLAWSKGLNFDEALALRSGWLALQHADATPVLWSPWTLALGCISHAFDSPAAVLRLARAVSLAWLLCGVWASCRGQGAACAALALLLAGCSDPVIAHLVEFRYDTSLIGAALLYQALLNRDRPLSWLSGLLLGFVMLHQLKGLALGGLLLLFTVLARQGRVDWPRLLLGMTGVVLSWIALSALCSQAGSWRDGYALFAELARTVPRAAGETRPQLAPLLAICCAALGLCAWHARQTEPWISVAREQLAEQAGWLAFSVVALLHPRLFPYHLTPIALLAALAAARQWHALWPTLTLPLAASLPLLQAAAFWLGGVGSIRSVKRVLSAPLDEPIGTLRALKAAAQLEDRVFDPSGSVYFLPPCGREWYVDTLFATWVQGGRWMYTPLSPPCTWSLRTYRLSLVPPAHLAELPAFRLHPGTGGLLSTSSVQREVEPLGLRDRTSSCW